MCTPLIPSPWLASWCDPCLIMSSLVLSCSRPYWAFFFLILRWLCVAFTLRRLSLHWSSFNCFVIMSWVRCVTIYLEGSRRSPWPPRTWGFPRSENVSNLNQAALVADLIITSMALSLKNSSSCVIPRACSNTFPDLTGLTKPARPQSSISKPPWWALQVTNLMI